ncbi:MAG: hypothetical protein N3G22_01290 [Candidatus Micrarchaeota archaeon]|nr:hypothetical protein [Candidatus Micrarchaeota archaeon]
MEEDFEGQLRNRLGSRLEGSIKSKIDEFGGLLTREAAIRLICRENGISIERKTMLKDATSPYVLFSFEAKVDRVFPVQTYPDNSRSIRLHVSDSTGSATLVLYNEQAAFAQEELIAGDLIEVRGAYLQDGEIAISRAGAVRKLKSAEVPKIENLKEGSCTVEGVVEKILPDLKYRDRAGGKEKIARSFLLCNEGKCCRVIFWSVPEEAVHLKEGQRIILENALFRGGELHFNRHSRLVARGQKRHYKAGVVEEARVNGQEMVFKIGGAEYRAPLDSALQMLGIWFVPQGVEKETAASIKGQSLIGKKISYSSEGGRLVGLLP